jgi:hypothetical protein
MDDLARRLMGMKIEDLPLNGENSFSNLRHTGWPDPLI